MSELAERCGRSRHQVGRWLNGTAQPRLPETYMLAFKRHWARVAWERLEAPREEEQGAPPGRDHQIRMHWYRGKYRLYKAGTGCAHLRAQLRTRPPVRLSG